MVQEVSTKIQQRMTCAHMSFYPVHIFLAKEGKIQHLHSLPMILLHVFKIVLMPPIRGSYDGAAAEVRERLGRAASLGAKQIRRRERRHGRVFRARRFRVLDALGRSRCPPITLRGAVFADSS